MFKLGLCCGGGLCCAILGSVLWLGGGNSMVGQAAEVVADKTSGRAKTGCTKAGCEEHAGGGAPCGMRAGDVEDVELTADEQKVVAYIADKIEQGELPRIDGEELEDKVGLSEEAIGRLDESKLRAGVMAELDRRNFDLASLGGNCSKYNLHRSGVLRIESARSFQFATAASSAAMSIFRIFIIASKARFASSGSELVVRSSSRLGVICQEKPQRSLHQPQALSAPPLPMIASR